MDIDDHLAIQNLNRIKKFIEIEAPRYIIKCDTDLLNRKIFGSRTRAVMFMIKNWWAYSKLNIIFHYKLWQVERDMRKQDVKKN